MADPSPRTRNISADEKRYLFSQVTNFEFYDFHDDNGYVNENVITYSNRAGKECAVVFFHNTYAECKGYIKHSQ